jgi:hypothetical protein
VPIFISQPFEKGLRIHPGSSKKIDILNLQFPDKPRKIEKA